MADEVSIDELSVRVDELARLVNGLKFALDNHKHDSGGEAVIPLGKL